MYLPDVDEVVAAFGAFLFDGGHGANFLVFLGYDSYELLEVVMDGFAGGGFGFFWGVFFNVSTF